MTAPSGVISSPNYPQPYPVNRECRWYVSVEPGKRVNITIVDFDMEAHQHCAYDKLAVRVEPLPVSLFEIMYIRDFLA